MIALLVPLILVSEQAEISMDAQTNQYPLVVTMDMTVLKMHVLAKAVIVRLVVYLTLLMLSVLMITIVLKIFVLLLAQELLDV